MYDVQNPVLPGEIVFHFFSCQSVSLFTAVRSTAITVSPAETAVSAARRGYGFDGQPCAGRQTQPCCPGLFQFGVKTGTVDLSIGGKLAERHIFDVGDRYGKIHAFNSYGHIAG